MKPDSLIFDMDGTLWSAVDTYAHALTEALKCNGIDKVFTGNDMKKYMGIELRQIISSLFPDTTPELFDSIYAEVVRKEQEFLSQMGGILYEDVLDSLERLSTKYKLFMLSNCQERGIRDFMQFTETKHLFVDYIEHGYNQQPKSVNLKILIDRNNIKSPVYIGDTDLDSKEASLAYVPFVFVSWGFGHTDNYTLKFDSMKDLADHFMSL